MAGKRAFLRPRVSVRFAPVVGDVDDSPTRELSNPAEKEIYAVSYSTS
jgi:hypothetical protein